MEQELLRLVEIAVESCGADQVEAVGTAGPEAVTRFANNTIHQMMAERDQGLTVRAVVGKRIGCASGTVQTEEDARRIAAEALELARAAEELPDFVSLTEPRPLPEAPPTVADDVVTSTPDDRSALISRVLQIAAERSMVAAGALSVSHTATAVANSLGVRVSRTSTRAHFHVVMQAEDSAGYAAAEGRALADARVEATALKAAEKAMLGRHPRHVTAEPMPVVLEPVAAAELLGMFATGFSAMAYQEEQSFVCDWLGQQPCSSLFTLVDDALDERTYVRTFDYEGVPKQRVELVREGTIAGLVYDTYTAGRADPPVQSTGHATPPPGRWGPYPANVIVQPGKASVDELVAQVDRGLLVSRVHYLNFAHRRKMILTGMTREGTFLIEKGEIVCGVHNLRFTERFVEALGRLQAIGSEGELHGNIWTPPLLIDGFTFTSETEF